MCCHVSSTNTGPCCNTYTVSLVRCWYIFTQLQITFKGGGGRLLLAKYNGDLLLIGCMARLDNKRQHLLTWLANMLK